jgi:sugar phosphate isomerase/epimerase
LFQTTIMPRGEEYFLSALLTSLPFDFGRGIRELQALGFTHVDLVGLAERSSKHLEMLAESGLTVSCGAIGRELPEGCTLDAPSVALRRTAVELMQRQIADIARLGGLYVYVVPPRYGSNEAVARFSEACVLLADFAAGRMVRLCIEHCPGTALPTAAAALAMLELIGHANLGLLLDVGHCLISGEDPAAVVAQGKERLFYVHLDDNDGVSDLHWPLLTGCLTEASLRAALASLITEGFAGALALELRAGAEPVEALRQGRQLVQRLLQEIRPSSVGLSSQHVGSGEGTSDAADRGRREAPPR